eukprot:XP_014068855.1 PREDICTED: ES1 protein homolog, mitochondrial-like [Salmo salar]
MGRVVHIRVRAGAKVQMFAPNVDQMHVVNHCEGKPIAEKRNVLEESARIARGDVSDLAKLEVTAFDALVIPAQYILCQLTALAVRSVSSVRDNLCRLYAQDLQYTSTVMCCISPVLAAKALPGCEITVGQDKECERWPYAKTATSMKELGCKHVNKKVGEVHIDVKNKLVTSAFMCNAPIHEVFDRVGVMVTELLKLA